MIGKIQFINFIEFLKISLIQSTMSYQQFRPSNDVHRLNEYVPTYVPRSEYLPTNRVVDANQPQAQKWPITSSKRDWVTSTPNAPLNSTRPAMFLCEPSRTSSSTSPSQNRTSTAELRECDWILFIRLFNPKPALFAWFGLSQRSALIKNKFKSKQNYLRLLDFNDFFENAKKLLWLISKSNGIKSALEASKLQQLHMDKYYQNDKKKAILEAFKISFANKAKPEISLPKKHEQKNRPKPFKGYQSIQQTSNIRKWQPEVNLQQQAQLMIENTALLVQNMAKLVALNQQEIQM